MPHANSSGHQIQASDLHVIGVYSNPNRYEVRPRLLRQWLPVAQRSGATIHVVEHAFGDRDYEFAAAEMAGVNLIQVRGTQEHWLQYGLYNLGIARLPDHARYVCVQDTDIEHMRPDWALETIHMLQHHKVGQTWGTSVDFNPSLDAEPNEHGNWVDRSFCAAWLCGDVDIGCGPYAPPYSRVMLPKKDRDWRSHCLPADSRVIPGGRIVSVRKQPFRGQLVVIRTRDGEELACSPNHPIFSHGRWIRADSINVGDNVVRHVSGNGRLGSHPDEKHFPARIVDVVKAFSERSDVGRTVFLADDLDDNAADQKVTEVWTDSNLTRELYARGMQKVRDPGLGAVPELNLSSLDRCRPHDLLGEAFGLSLPPHQAAGAPAGLPLLNRRFAEHARTDCGTDFLAAIGVGAVPCGFTSGAMKFGRRSGAGECFAGGLIHPFVDDAPGIPFIHADDPSTLWSGLAGQIGVDEVVFVGRREFSGHLYDLETEHGYIIADKLITHNTGYSWAFRRDVLRGLGRLPDWLIAGSSDWHMALGFSGRLRAMCHKELSSGGAGRYSQGYYDRLLQFADACDRWVNMDIGCVPGLLTHHWHGSKKHRHYGGREAILTEAKFDPIRHLVYDAHGLPTLCTDNPALREGLRRYSKARNEDSIDIY